MLARSLRTALILALAQSILHAPLAGQAENLPHGPWSLRIRAVLSGDSYESDPAGYKIYSGLALEAAVVRRVSDVVSVELSLRTESREVEGPAGGPGDHRLGSLEMAPLTLAAQWRPRGGGDAGFQPYVGAGINVTGTWEKSGALDSTNPPPSVGPAIQLGADLDLSRRTVLNLDLKWHTMTVDIEDFGATVPSVKIDPLILGLGVGVRF